MMNASAKEKGNHVVSLARIVRNTRAYIPIEEIGERRQFDEGYMQYG